MAEGLNAHEARRMTRAEALQMMLKHGDAFARHMAELMLAGPDITEDDAARLAGTSIRLTPIAANVRGIYAR